jgi:hypothetical protein
MPHRKIDINTRTEAYHNLSLSLSKFAVDGDAILMGDFNAYIGKPKNAAEAFAIGNGDINKERAENGQLMIDLLIQHQLVTRRVLSGPTATRAWYGDRSMLDFIASSTSLDMSALIIDHDETGSDHRPIRSVIRSIASVERSKVTKVKMWNMKNFEGSAVDKYQSLIKESFQGWRACKLPHIPPHTKCPSCGRVAGRRGAQCCCNNGQAVVDNAAMNWLEMVNNAAHVAIGEKTIVKGKSKPWFTKEVAAMVAEKRKCAAIMIKSVSVEEAKVAAERVRELIRLIAIEKRRCYDQLQDDAQSLFDKNKSKQFWSIMKMLSGKGKSSSNGTVRVKNSAGITALTDRENRANWAAFYHRLANEDGANGRYDQQFKQVVERSIHRWSQKHIKRGTMQLFSRLEVRKAIKLLPNGKACGIDRIPNEFIKKGGKPMVIALTSLFNCIIKNEVTPSTWERGLICNIFKSGAVDMCDNYRGITLLSNVYKLFTKLLTQRLSAHLEGKGKLTPSQCGFRPRRGCPDQVFVLSRIIERRRATGHHTHLFFLDVKKAFDTVWRNGVISSLIDMEVDPQLTRIIRNMYRKTTAAVLVDGSPTEFFDQTIGVRQGCPLSPLLYIAFINGLAKEIDDLKCGVKVTANGDLISSLFFADDVVLTAPTPGNLQRMIDCVAAYARKWRFDANVAKCAIMSIVAPGAKKAYTPIAYTFDGKAIPVVKEYTLV